MSGGLIKLETSGVILSMALVVVSSALQCQPPYFCSAYGSWFCFTCFRQTKDSSCRLNILNRPGYVDTCVVDNQTLNTTFNGFMCETGTWTFGVVNEGESGNITVMMETVAPNGSVLAVSQKYNLSVVFLKLTLGGHNHTGWSDVIQLSPWSTDVYPVTCMNPLDDLDIHIDLTCSRGVNRSVGLNSVQVDDVRVSRADDGQRCECLHTLDQMGGSRYIYGAVVEFVYTGPSYIELSITPSVNNMSCPSSLHAVHISCLVPFTEFKLVNPHPLTMAIGAGGALHPKETLISETGRMSQLDACLHNKSYITCYAWNGIQHYGPVINSTLFLVPDSSVTTDTDLTEVIALGASAALFFFLLLVLVILVVRSKCSKKNTMKAAISSSRRQPLKRPDRTFRFDENIEMTTGSKKNTMKAAISSSRRQPLKRPDRTFRFDENIEMTTGSIHTPPTTTGELNTSAGQSD